MGIWCIGSIAYFRHPNIHLKLKFIATRQDIFQVDTQGYGIWLYQQKVV